MRKSPHKNFTAPTKHRLVIFPTSSQAIRHLLVIGATGTVGRQVVYQLIAANVGVRALTRNPDSASLPAQVEIVRGDLTIPDTLDRPLDDVDAVFLVWTAPETAFAPAWARIEKHVARVVFLSSPHQTAHPFFQQPNPVATMHAEIERLIEASGLRWTFLRPGMFAANSLLWWAPQIHADDIVRWPYAKAPTAPIHERDASAGHRYATERVGGRNRPACVCYILSRRHHRNTGADIPRLGVR